MIETHKLVTFSMPRVERTYKVMYVDNKISHVLDMKDEVVDPDRITTVENVVLGRVIHKIAGWARAFVYLSPTAVGKDTLIIVENHEGFVYMHTLNSPDGLLLGLEFNRVVSQIKGWR